MLLFLDLTLLIGFILSLKILKLAFLNALQRVLRILVHITAASHRRLLGCFDVLHNLIGVFHINSPTEDVKRLLLAKCLYPPQELELPQDLVPLLQLHHNLIFFLNVSRQLIR